MSRVMARETYMHPYVLFFKYFKHVWPDKNCIAETNER